MDAIRTITEGNKEISIYYDETPTNPREWDNLGHMICFHKRYSLGDKHFINSDRFDNWDSIEEYLQKEYKAYIILPLFLYDHSGITISTSPFSCRWDSGQIGFIYTTKKDIKENHISETEAKAHLEEEVKVYNQYLMGEQYEYIIRKKSTCPTCNHEDKEIIESCGGFFSIEDAEAEARSYLSCIGDR